MPTTQQIYAQQLRAELLRQHPVLRAHGDDPHKLIAPKQNGDDAILDLTPFAAVPQAVDAAPFFSNVKTITDLLVAYRRARKSRRFEDDLPAACQHVHAYAHEYLDALLAHAAKSYSDTQAQLIAAWVKNLDIYVAVKAIESLLNSKADLALLELAADNQWTVHFDHLAIRCGHSGRGDAERVVQLLEAEHGYVATQVAGEDFYQFSDGWNAYPLYKILSNGQVLRLFIDQSDADHPTQIIQHWNRVYGYTAHHMGLRVSTHTNTSRRAVTLDELSAALARVNITALTPTGDYTQGLLLQVFTKPERNPRVPSDVKNELLTLQKGLEVTVENAKLLELVSRQEVPQGLARQYFALYGLNYAPNDPIHSAPAYCYFLPAQAAHVIKTSIESLT